VSEGTRSNPLSADALARLNRENVRQGPVGGGGGGGRDERRRERERERGGREERVRAREVPRERTRERGLRAERETGRERSRGYERVRVSAAEDDEDQQRDRGKKKKSRRVVSGAVLEEGRGGGRGGKGWTGLRGGAAWRASDDSMLREKQDLYAGKKRPWYKQKKKLCKC
jgi:glucan 1,3-beta-glucosidase